MAVAAGVILVVAAIVGGAALASAQPNSWSATYPAGPASSTDELFGISCPTVDFCASVGQASDKDGNEYGILETWNGSTWTSETDPDMTSNGDEGLSSVSCTSAAFCLAVGFSGSETQSPVVETWNGTNWSVGSSVATVSDEMTQLSSVSCVSSTMCVAAGSAYASSVGPSAVVEQWNGSTWTIATSQGASGEEKLDGVSCASATFCVAVGVAYSNTAAAPLVDAWNGSTWTFASPPNPGTYASLASVSCSDATDCLAVGGTYTSSLYFEEGLEAAATAESWNGTAWTVVSPPSPSGFDEFTGVSCSGAADCTAVGYASSTITSFSDSPSNVVIQTWNGTAWTADNPPSLPATVYNAVLSTLNAVSCWSSTSCTAVGALGLTDLLFETGTDPSASTTTSTTTTAPSSTSTTAATSVTSTTVPSTAASTSSGNGSASGNTGNQTTPAGASLASTGAGAGAMVALAVGLVLFTVGMIGRRRHHLAPKTSTEEP